MTEIWRNLVILQNEQGIMTGYHKLTEKKKQENDEEGNSFIKYTIIFLIIEYNIIINNTCIMKVSLK